MAAGMYIVISHIKRFNNRSNTWENEETCLFLDRLKNKHKNESTVILDFVKKTVVKDRNKGTYATNMCYLWDKYPKELTELQSVYDNLYK